MKQKRIVSMIGALVLIIGAVVLISGCQQANDGKKNNELGKTELAVEYIGLYEGISSGEVLGLWTIKADETGLITGEFKQNEKHFPISGNVKNDGKFTASANIRAASSVITISGTIDKKSGKVFGTVEKDSKKSLLCGYKQSENIGTVNDNLFSVWKLKSIRTIGKDPIEIEYPMEIPIDENDSSKIVKIWVYFLFMEKNELYHAVEISGIPNPSPIPNLSNGLFKTKINYSSLGKQIAVVSDVNGNKMSIVGEFTINGNNLIIDGLMKLSYSGEEETMKSKWTFEKVLSPSVDAIKNASDVPVIQP